MSFMEEFQHLKIQLEIIKSATNDFGDEPIGTGGFGKVYKGELSLPDGRRTVAFKRLDRKLGQGDNEFWKEIMMLSEYKHENLVALLHFCNDPAEKVLVYEYASRGSLNRYLSDPSLTWTQRIKICIGAARGLNYLHDPMGTQKRVLHRDVKSSNILLDDKWNAKISDFGLSKIGPANQMHTFLVSNAVGTPGYCDPLYIETGFLSKESDVYSFGVVLFEVMCGRLCWEYRNDKLCIFVPMWKKRYEDDRIDDIICPHLKDQIDGDSLMMFSTIAYRCLKRDRKERPSMSDVIIELEAAVEQEGINDNVEERIMFEERRMIADLAVPPLSYRSRSELYLLLSKGILVAGGTTWVSTDKNGQICEMISAVECISGKGLLYHSSALKTSVPSRFSHILRPSPLSSIGFKVKVSTQFLSPHVMYTINLVFRPTARCHMPYVPFKYKLDKETQYLTSSIAHERENGWLMTELYQFTSDQKKHEFTINFLYLPSYEMLLEMFEGIEFRPVEHKKHEKLEDENTDLQSTSNSDTDCERKLPTDYTNLIQLSKNSVQWTTKKELHLLFRNGFLIDNGEKWLSFSKNMKKRLMLPAKAILREEEWIWQFVQESRFELVAESLGRNSFFVACKVESQLLSPQATYSCHLLYKLPKDLAMDASLVKIKDASRVKIEYKYKLYNPPYPFSNDYQRYVYLLTPPHIPIIEPKDDQDTHKIKGHPKLRKDGWMEFQVGEVQADTRGIDMDIKLLSFELDKWGFNGLIVQGIEFRPI